MKGDTPLDYAEFQLTPKRTRCELFISADGSMEKLASGFLKPFVTHMRAAEVQVAKGNQVIRLDNQGRVAKHHHQGQSSWFCKGTLERFVRFVSTPEVIERVKTIEDELTQLEQVRSALVNTFVQAQDRFSYGDSITGGQQRIVAKDNEPDASKKDLLRAMEARLSALHQEQYMAFSRANAAGFDDINIADLTTFAEQFGAERLHDACVQFLALSSKRIVHKGEENITSPTIETPLDGSTPRSASSSGSKAVSGEEIWLHRPKRRLDFGANKIQRNLSGGVETVSEAAGMVFGRMAPQAEVRSSEDFGWQMDKDASRDSPQGPQNDAPDSVTWREPAFTPTTPRKLAATNNLSKTEDSTSSLPERTSSLPALKVRSEGSLLWNPTSVKALSVKNLAAEDLETKAEDNARKLEETSGADADHSNNPSTQGETPARRLSVQAAISLFESKKKDSSEPPFRKLIKQESRKALTESGNSPSEKSVLKRWSGASPCSQDEKNIHEKKGLDTGGMERGVEPECKKGQDGGGKVSSLNDGQFQYVPDEEARENFKKSLNDLLHTDSTQGLGRNDRFNGSDVGVRQVKQLPPIEQPFQNIAGRLDPTDRLKIDHVGNLKRTEAEVVVSSKAKPEPPSVAMPTIVNDFKNPVTVFKPDGQPISNTVNLEYNGKIEQADVIKGNLKGQNMKIFLPKPSDSFSNMSKFPAQICKDQENVGPIACPAPKEEQIIDRKTETVRSKETSDSARPLGKSENHMKASAQRKGSSGKELPINLLTTSVDLHMQALVKMVEHQYTNISLNGMEVPNEQRGEHRGRFYDQYSKLREAKIKCEHPAKKAEREAKLRSMQETLERRKAEMDSRAVRRMKVRKQGVDPGSEKVLPQKAGLTVAMVEQIDLKDEEDDTNQEECSLRSHDHLLEYSNSNSPATTPRSSKMQTCSMNSRTPSKSVSVSRNSVRAVVLSPKSTAKNPIGTPSQGKPPTPSNSSVDSTAIKAVLNIKDVAKCSLIRATGSARVHPRVNVSSNDTALLRDDCSNVAAPCLTEKKEPRHSSLVKRKNFLSIAVSKSLPTEAGMLPVSPAGATDSMIDGKAPQSLGVTAQEVRPFLRKGRGIGPGAGPGIMKQKASAPLDTPKSFDDDTSVECKQEGVVIGSEATNSTLETSDENCEGTENACLGKEREAVEESCAPMLDDESGKEREAVEESCAPMLDDESASPSSRGGEVEASDYLPGSASETEKACHDTINFSEEPPEVATLEKINSSTQSSFVHVPNHEDKEGTFLLSDLLSQQNTEPLQHSAGFVKSSLSFREDSLPHGQIGSPFPASMSHVYSSLLQRGAVSSRFSPPRSSSPDLPTTSPALWNAAQTCKYIQAEPDLMHSRRHSSGPQKPTFMVPLPPKEPSKGLKRLLHFGRKSRPETATTDCISVSTTSEGDDDADEVKDFGSQLSDELLRKLRMQKRGFEYGSVGEHYSFPEQDTSQFFGSSIPPPPANFKLREEHLSGGNLIKGPRSFFSLSSFRSKGGEGKSR